MGVFSRAIRLPTGDFPPAKPKIIFTTLPPPDASEQSERGLITIQGSSVSIITLNHSHSSSTTRSVKKETKRTYDEVRVKNPDAPNQHVDVQRPVRVTVSPTSVGVNSGGASVIIYAKQPPEDNVEVLSTGNEQRNPDYP